ncbi:MAG TPA: monooxygenase [Ramlibacter sp.]|nr:monooxygenase [Ramlibacter sp.]
MVIAFTTFTLPSPITRDQALRIFTSTAPTYRGVQGLLRKHYVLSEDGRSVGGVYVWESRADAEAMYTPAWRAFVREKYGTEPSVTYFDSPVVVDNVAQRIVADSPAVSGVPAAAFPRTGPG